MVKLNFPRRISRRAILITVVSIIAIVGIVDYSFPLRIRDHSKATKAINAEFASLEKPLGWPSPRIAETATCAAGNGGESPSPYKVVCQYTQTRTYGLDIDAKTAIERLATAVRASGWQDDYVKDPLGRMLKDYNDRYGTTDTYSLYGSNGQTTYESRTITVSDLKNPDGQAFNKDGPGLRHKIYLGASFADKNADDLAVWALVDNQKSHPESTSEATIPPAKQMSGYLSESDLRHILSAHPLLVQLIIRSDYYAR